MPRITDASADWERRTTRRSRSSAAISDVQTVAWIPTMSCMMLAASVTACGIQARRASWRQTHVALAASGAEPAESGNTYCFSTR